MTRAEIHATFTQLFAADSPAPVPIEDIRAAEGELVTTFPQSYLDFITCYGAIYTPAILDLVTGGESEIAPEGASFDVQNFLTPAEIVETTRLYWSGGMDNWVVAVASDCMGNVFGFRKDSSNARPEDSMVFIFDHDFCETKEESPGFDNWLLSFIRLKQQ